MPTSYPNAKNSSWQDDRLLASLQHLFDPCWIALPRWSTTCYHKLSPTTWQKEMSSISSSSSKTPISTVFLHHVYIIKTSLASSRASTLIGSSIAGDSPCSFFLPSWAQTRTKSSRWRQPRATPQEMLSKDVRAVHWTWPGRSLFIRDIERIILMSLKMTQFSIGTSVYEQIRGSPMGSPLSPALCMMVVALSEEIWYRTYRTTLTTMDLSARLLRYVDNRLCLADPSWDYEISFTNFLHPEFYGNPIILETEPDQEFLGFCIEFEPFALRYNPPRDFNQVMAPFSASPLAVQLSGFVSRLFLVAKCAHPALERTRGFAALHRLYRAAGFCESDLTAAAKPIHRYLHTSSLW